MTWVNPTNMLLDIDDPARSVDIKAIANNSAAMANGDAGAPKIKLAALDSAIKILGAPVAGTTFTQKHMGLVSNAEPAGGTAGDRLATYIAVSNALPLYPSAVKQTFTTQVSGVVTAEITYVASGGGSIMGFYKNASLTPFDTTTLPDSAGTTKTKNLTVSKGDVVSCVFDGTAGSCSGSVIIKTGNDVVCVA